MIRHTLVHKWQIHETHWCDNHQKVERSKAWATEGLISVIEFIDKEDKKQVK
jgi:hypothetical protein